MSKKSISLSKKIRKHAVEMTHLGKSSHIASILSISDIIAVLYEEILNINPKKPKDKYRDRFILSKGHSGAAVYAALAEKGFFHVKKLKTHCANGSFLSGHVSHKNIPGVELSTGSLGHGLSVACGMAMYAKLEKLNHKIFVLMSDGECDEGSNWEAILFSPHHNLNNLIVIIDYNKLQSIETTSSTLELEPFKDKWESFGWSVFNVDGHNHRELKTYLEKSKKNKKPCCIIAHTTKGKGVSFMENNNLWHYRSPQGDEYIKAINELDRE